MVHKPMMSEAEAEKRLAWQNGVYEGHLKCAKRISIDFNGIKIVVLRNVFGPAPLDSNLLAKTVLKEVKETDKILDMGTGSGIQAILAASKSVDIVAVDVNPFAVECAKLNVELNKLSSRIKVRKSDLFRNIKEKFDLIIFDPPFRWSKPRDLWERSCADEDYVTLQNFFEEAERHLTDGGRILVHFGTSGDISFFRYLIRKNGFKRKQILKEGRKGWTYFIYRLTRK